MSASTWIELTAKGRHAGPVRAGMWSTVVIGTHPIQVDQRVWLEVSADDVVLELLPAFWIENRAENSLWHVPIPPRAVGSRLHYRSVLKQEGCDPVYSGYQDVMIRPNIPESGDSPDISLLGVEGLTGNRRMTIRVDGRGTTYDVYYPTVGMHSNVRPKEGDLPQSRSHFRTIVGGLAAGNRLDWFSERGEWDQFQHYLGATNLLTTELNWRKGPIRVLITDFVAMGNTLPSNAGREISPGQYIKRFRIKNEGSEARRTLFGVYVRAEVNGGVGDLGLSWRDEDRALLAINRGHGHTNRKLARNSTVEFAIALDGRGDILCEPTGPNEAMLLRWLDLPVGESVTVDLLISGAFTGWSGDQGTFEHWLRPALNWFRTSNIDQVEQSTALEWDEFVEPLPNLYFPKASFAVSLRRSALAAALHVDAEEGGVAAGYERGLNAYCWPREAIWVGEALDRLGHHEIGRGVFRWLDKVRGNHRPFLYWFQKYSIDGAPEWETPSVDQTALIPWSLEKHYRRTGDLDQVASLWPMIEQAATVCEGNSGGHPGLRMLDDLNLISSAGMRDQLFGAHLYSNSCVVAGLFAAARLARVLDREESARDWERTAERILNEGILKESRGPAEPGLIDPETGRFLMSRRISKFRALWTRDPEMLIDRPQMLSVKMLAPAAPLGILPASNPQLVRTAESLIRINHEISTEPQFLSQMSFNVSDSARTPSARESQGTSTLATLWMARYLIQLGRETGQGRHWTRALAMLEAISGRLSQLGLSLRPSARGVDSGRVMGNSEGTAWRLHAMLIEILLDLGGLDHDAVDRRITISPVLPGTWPSTGMTQIFSCGEVAFRLERPIGGTVHRLSVRPKLKHAVTLQVHLTCPGLRELGPWHSTPPSDPPEFDSRTGRLSWSTELEPGDSELSWTWG